mmetsp:Transcript_41249/g.74586  ORF Transcript_41249/g.74586 Transcript_41249/m.74586 type:complete len:184 (-) Transcript_41249:20-571(-)
MAMDEGPCIFATVGTTSFDALVQQLDTIAFHKAARELGYKQIVVQKGRGSYIPKLTKAAPPDGVEAEDLLCMTAYDFKPSLDDDIERAQLIVSHAGAGSILEAVRAGRRLLVVVNPLLMDNHQLEMAEVMQEGGHCTAAREPSELIARLAVANTATVQPFPARDLDAFHRAVADVVGVPPCGT